MAFIKIGFLSALVALTYGDFHHDMIYDSYASHSFSHPWYLHDYHRPESSELVPHFISSPYYYDTAASSLQPSGFKRTPSEHKHLKKPHQESKFKEVFKSSPRCQEISAKESTAHPAVDPHRKRISCYKCKDPVSGSIFEQCSYSSQKPEDSLSSASNPPAKKKKNYRFPEEYFHHHQPEESVEKEATNGCERVVRNSMVCMVCRDPKTNGKYEQCSYVANPNEKAFGYSKSSSFGKQPKVQEQTAPKAQKVKAPQAEPEEEELEEAEETEESTEPDTEHFSYDEPEDYGHEESGSTEDKEGHYTYHYPSSYHGDSYEADDGKQDAKSTEGSCKTVHRDGQSCKVCTNPKTGGESERCDYAHEPKDKVYKYSKSKSFGYPESNSGASNNNNDESSSSAQSSSQDEEYEPTNVEVAKQKGCRKVKRDNMVCSICKDPKTGEDSEQCNYSYDPEDKVFAYTKSNSFGSPYSGAYEETPEDTSAYGASSVIYPTGTSPLDYIPKTSESRVHATREQKPKEKKGLGKRVDTGFDDAKVRRAEIEKITKDPDTEDKSKCKKVKRGDMTCYRCVDGKGSTNEECVFVADPEPDEQPSSTTPTSSTEVVKPGFRRRTRSTSKEDEDEDKVDEEEVNDTEPYDFVAETRPVYDKVLGLTLPAYMLTKSPHEIEFDKFVQNTRDS